MVEALALWRTMVWSTEFGLEDMTFEGDAKELIDAMRSEAEDES